MNSIIKFLRSSGIQDNLDSAIKKLDQSPNKKGQPIVVFYYADTSKTLIDCVFGIGLEDSTGPKSYSIISSSSTIIVQSVLTELPDVTSLIDGQISIYRNEDEGKTYWIYLEDGKRELTKTEIKEDPRKYYLVKESTTGILWWIGKNEIKKAYDFPSSGKFNKLSDKTSSLLDSVNKISTEISNINEKIDLLSELVSLIELNIKMLDPETTIFQNGHIIKDAKLRVQVELGKDDITDECSFELLIGYTDKTTKKLRLNVQNNEAIIEDEVLDRRVESLTVTAIYNTEHTDSKSLSISFVEPSFYGTITYKKLEVLNGQVQSPWLVGLPLLDEGVETSFYSGPNWDKTAITNILMGILKEERELLETYEVSLSMSKMSEMLLDKNESFIYTGEHSLNDHMFFAYPYEFGELKSIEDPSYGGNILDSFREYSQVNLEIEGTEIPYYVYVKKQPAVNNNVVFKFNH